MFAHPSLVDIVWRFGGALSIVVGDWARFWLGKWIVSLRGSLFFFFFFFTFCGRGEGKGGTVC